MKKAAITIQFMVGILINSYAQQTICGKVVDNATGEAQAGVNITIDGTTIHAITDLDGKYRLADSEKNPTVTFSYVGYLTEVVELGDRTVLNVALTKDVVALDEVTLENGYKMTLR